MTAYASNTWPDVEEFTVFLSSVQVHGPAHDGRPAEA
jgi:hypothetical protein